MPVNRKVVEADPEGWFLKPETYVGNGPFKVTKWVHNSYLELEKNPLYWDADSVILDKLVATTIESEDTELVMFETGQLDITNTVSRPGSAVGEEGLQGDPQSGHLLLHLQLRS